LDLRALDGCGVPAVAVDLQTSLADIEFAGFLTLKRPEETITKEFAYDRQ